MSRFILAGLFLFSLAIVAPGCGGGGGDPEPSDVTDKKSVPKEELPQLTPPPLPEIPANNR